MSTYSQSISICHRGVTRLTESGLSMVTWKLLGEKKPSNKSEWEAEFCKYKQFPEFKMLNSSMTEEEFKFIYLMEYSHRMWGRAIGFFFLIPAIYFWKRGYFSYAVKKRIILSALLIGGQGLMGWYMVKSGLEDRFQDTNDIPRVSQYRLAAHLFLALTLHSLCLSTALSQILPSQKLGLTIPLRRTMSLQRMAYIAQGLIFLTAITGAFVAGLDAGLVYNSFPKMSDNWIPDEIFAKRPFIINFTENPATVQFNHRVCGISTLLLISILYLSGKRVGLPKRAYWAVKALAISAWLQATLGVSTLINHVPVAFAAAHQSVSLLLLSISIWLSHEMKLIKYLPK